MDRDSALEYSESLAQVGNGWWRQMVWAARQGIPAALGLSVDEWRARYYGNVRLLPEERREAVAELTAEGMTGREIADVLGVGKDTVRRDRGANAPHEQQKPSAEAPDPGANAPTLDDLYEKVVPEERRARIDLDGTLLTRGPEVAEVVNRWSKYLTDQDRQIVANIMDVFGRALRADRDVRLERVR